MLSRIIRLAVYAQQQVLRCESHRLKLPSLLDVVESKEEAWESIVAARPDHVEQHALIGDHQALVGLVGDHDWTRPLLFVEDLAIDDVIFNRALMLLTAFNHHFKHWHVISGRGILEVKSLHHLMDRVDLLATRIALFRANSFECIGLFWQDELGYEVSKKLICSFLKVVDK